MKKILFSFIIMLFVVAITGCGNVKSIEPEQKVQEPEQVTQKQEKTESTTTMKEMDKNRVYLYIDPDTGVNYLVHSEFRHGGGMTVRVDANGNPIVTPVDTTK